MKKFCITVVNLDAETTKSYEYNPRMAVAIAKTLANRYHPYVEVVELATQEVVWYWMNGEIYNNLAAFV